MCQRLCLRFGFDGYNRPRTRLHLRLTCDLLPDRHTNQTHLSIRICQEESIFGIHTGIIFLDASIALAYVH